MRRITVRLHPPSVVLGVLLLAGVLLSASAMQLAPRIAIVNPVDVRERPDPTTILNFDSANANPAPNGSLDVAPGQILGLFQVPSGKHLIITEMRWTFDGNISLVEDLGGSFVVKQGIAVPPGSHSYRPGLSFQPGSTVALHNPLAVTSNALISFSGYLLDL